MTVGESSTEINAITPFWVGQYSTPTVGQFSVPIYRRRHVITGAVVVPLVVDFTYDYGRTETLTHVYMRLPVSCSQYHVATMKATTHIIRTQRTMILITTINTIPLMKH